MCIIVIGDTFTFKDHVRILQYIQPLLPAEANINDYYHVHFLKLCIPLIEKVMGYRDFSKNKKPKRVLNFSESQTLITQRHSITIYTQSNLVLQKIKIK